MYWVTQNASETVLIRRQTPVRFDHCVETRFPFCQMNRVAHQIRQDMWGTLQNLRGFLPVVEIRIDTDDLSVREGCN